MVVNGLFSCSSLYFMYGLQYFEIDNTQWLISGYWFGAPAEDLFMS